MLFERKVIFKKYLKKIKTNFTNRYETDNIFKNLKSKPKFKTFKRYEFTF